MSEPKYIATTVALKGRQKDALEKAVSKMSKTLGIDLSRSDVIERMSKLYTSGKLKEGDLGET